MTDLLEALDALTKPTYTRVVQEVFQTIIGKDGRPKLDETGAPRRQLTGTKPVRLAHDPLLTQLQGAITGAMGNTEGSAASLKFTRGVINSDALFQFVRIRSTITDWARAAGLDRCDDPVDELRRWYHSWTATPKPDADEKWRTRKLESWATLIEDTIDPWRSMPLPGPCPQPECPQQQIDGLWFYWDQRTKEQGNRPLLVEYKRGDGTVRVEDWARARCRACGTVWATPRALQWDREHAEEERITAV